MQGQDFDAAQAQAELEREQDGMERERQEQQTIEEVLGQKVEEIQRRQRTEREAEVNRLHKRAISVLTINDLQDLHERQEDKLADLQALREQQAEQSRFLRRLTLELDTMRLDALSEMEAEEGYVPGKNEEQRRRQREAWLAVHDGYLEAQQVVLAGEATADGLELAHHRLVDELTSLKSLIQIRLGEMALISAFVGR